MEMIKVAEWAFTGFIACPKLNSKSISGKKIFEFIYKKLTQGCNNFLHENS